MKKIISIVCCAIICIIISGCGKKENYSKLSDEEFITTIGVWQYVEGPNIKYTLNKDKTGIYTTNGEDKQEFTWDINKGKLYINFGDDVEEVYYYSVDRDNIALTLDKNNYSKIFVKDGRIKTESIGNKKNNLLIGIWKSDDTILVLDNELSGYGYITKNKIYISNEIEWSSTDDTFEFINSSGNKKTYDYELSDNKLVIYSNGKKVRTYDKIKNKYKIEKV